MARARSGSAGGRIAMSLPGGPPAARAYRSAGRIVSSHCVTASRKLATITVSATDRARLATTPATAIVALSRWCRARSTASSASARRGGAMPASARPTPAGTQAMPPIRRHATDA